MQLSREDFLSSDHAAGPEQRQRNIHGSFFSLLTTLRLPLSSSEQPLSSDRYLPGKGLPGTRWLEEASAQEKAHPQREGTSRVGC